jgi:hypothetical protein
MSTVPSYVRQQIEDRLWAIADRIGWASLTGPEKTRYYENWARDTEVGEVLAAYSEVRNVRVYIKDVIMKPYIRERLRNPSPILRMLGLPDFGEPLESFVKPHGMILRDGKTVGWGPAKDWKSILVATYERAFRRVGATPYGVVLVRPVGRLKQSTERRLILDLATRLDIQKLEWVDKLA